MQRRPEFQPVAGQSNIESIHPAVRRRMRYLAGSCLATSLLAGVSALALGSGPAAAYSCYVTTAGVYTDINASENCVSTPVGGAPDDLDVILQDVNVGPGGVYLHDHDTTGPVEDPIDINLSVTDYFNYIGTISNDSGDGVNIESAGASTPDGVGGYWTRGRGVVSVNTQTGGDIYGSDRGIYALGSWVSITNDGATISGDLDSGGGVIQIDATGEADIFNDSGTIEYTGARPDENAIRVDSADEVYIYNGGTIFGEVDLRGGASSEFVNDSSHTWITTGANYFTLGADTLTNTPIGVIVTQDYTQLNFFNGLSGADRVENQGTIRADLVDLAHYTATAFTDLEEFDNSGLIDLHSGNAQAGDMFGLISGSGPSLESGDANRVGAYVATGEAELLIDSRLGGLATTNNVCGGTIGGIGLSDCLTIGSSTGTTNVLVKDTVLQSKASYNPTGILVVDGSSALNDFILDSGSDYYAASHVFETTTRTYRNVLDKGLWFYDLLYNNIADQHRLYGVPDAEAFELTKLGTAAQNIWYSTSPWLERQADLRDELSAGKDVTPGIWAKAIGGWGSCDTDENFGVAGYNYAYNINYQQNTYGAMAGVDAGGKGVFGEHDALLGGVSGGYVDSNVDFNSPTSASYKGAVAGIYVTYLSGDFYVDLSGKANFLTMDYSAPTLNGFTASPSVRTYGGQIEIGQRFGGSLFVEPLATLAYSTTSIDGFSALGTKVDFENAKSARGSLGLRIGGTAHVADTTLLSGSLTGRAWDEVEGKNEVTFHSEGPDLTLRDNFSGAFGEVSGNVSITGLESGVSGFISGGTKFKSGYTDTSVKIGVRLTF